ncbi:hypothetical protein [Aquibaculum arenosum]|uniref:Bile acid:sodium symporter n=1 Tax=Aquibaculum arenosum TaxID=3032591 RepID=A0ABT5YJ07_9PROT|nr:hypothetical protein [Fodinicurvata sp. CAU 1616]MDF2094872.1 hypothetical protein [Fodinicurvata sp. CAU 1616]
MLRLLSLLGGKGVPLLFVGVFIGLLLPGLANLLRPLLAPSVVLLLLFSLLRVDWQQVGTYLRRPLLTGGLVAWMLLASPVLTWAALAGVPLPSGLETAVILMAAAPPILGATAIALLLGLDGALTLVVGLISTLLAPVTIPPLSLWLLGLDLAIGTGELMLRLGGVVLLALLGALAIRAWLGSAWLRRNGVALDGMIVVIMLLFAVAIMDGVTETLLAQPAQVLLWLLAAFLANPALQAITMLAFWGFGRRLAMSAGLLAGNCNMGLLLATLSPDENFDVVLFFAIAQLPMFMLPAMMRPLYRRLLAPQQAST